MKHVHVALSIAMFALIHVAHAAVDVSLSPVKKTQHAKGLRREQSVTLANAVCHYRLTYDFIEVPDQPGNVTSNYWAWKGQWTIIGLTQPAKANWYYQSIFNWSFDDESLHNRRATIRVIRQSGPDGLVEFAWDTPKVRASVYFALATGSDKLLMFGRYEPKSPVKRSWIKLSCYPATFKKPHNRTLTTAKQTYTEGTVTLDSTAERWALLEDATPNRPTEGPAGLIIGTPDAFERVTCNAAGYQLQPQLMLKPGQRTFAIGLYSFPSMPDVPLTREYFRVTGDATADWLEDVADRFLDEPIPEMPVPPERAQAMRGGAEEFFKRNAERWSADPEPLAFPWANPLAGRPIRTVVLCPRFSAYEIMELTRRLSMDVKHIYFDTPTQIADSTRWPYRSTTGISSAQIGVASLRAAAICAEPDVDVFLVSRIKWAGIPGACRIGILEQVKQGKGLLLVEKDRAGFPKELFATPDIDLAEDALASVVWDLIPGYREGDKGRVGTDAPIRAYEYGEGRTVHLQISTHRYSTLVPQTTLAEGIEGAADRGLAVAAKAMLAAADRQAQCRVWIGDVAPDAKSVRVSFSSTPPADAVLDVRLRDEFDDLTWQYGRRGPLGREVDVNLTAMPTGRRFHLDLMLRDAQSRTLDFASAPLPEARGPKITSIALSPSSRVIDEATPFVDLPQGGTLTARFTVQTQRGLQDARLDCQVRDILGRRIGRASAPVPAAGGDVTVRLSLSRPVTVGHRLDAILMIGKLGRAAARQRFTMPMSYPYDDFTGLMWSYTGGCPVLLQTQRRCYEMGADVMDLAHMIRFDDAGADREYWVASQSGLRLIPYVTRLAGKVSANNHRLPCLHGADYYRNKRDYMVPACRQARAYSPVAFTLGDENYLFRGDGEVCLRPESIAAFRKWLEAKYGDVAALNAAWCTSHESFSAIEPMPMAEAAKQTKSFAPWLDHKRFLDTAFAEAHDRLADLVREQSPGAKVGWDGFLSNTWRAGYDFVKLTRNQELNQTYTSRWIQGELVRSLKRPDAFTGKWGNRVANNEEAFDAFVWECLLTGDQSAWWWTSWGCDYIPFNPDLTVNPFGRGFFRALCEVKAGPGRLLLHAQREHSRIAVLYSQPDLLFADLVAATGLKAPFAGARNFWSQHEALLKGLHDLGYQYRHVPYTDLEANKLSNDEFSVIVLSLASCLSDNQIATLRRFVEAGGTLIADGRVGLLDGNGKIRAERALADVFGLPLAAAADAVRQEPPEGALKPGPQRHVNAFGKGRVVLLNLAMAPLLQSRSTGGPKPELAALAEALVAANVKPPCQLTRADGSPPLCSQRIVYTDGSIRYLALQQNLHQYDLPPQEVRVKLPAPAIVYALRDGERLGEGEIAEWDATLSRGRPLVYSLMPYAVEAIIASAPANARRGDTITVSAVVRTSAGAAEYHVVRLDVFAPGTRTPHREYSQNIPCPAGRGAITIPFALNDGEGEWRLVFRDGATGVKAARTLRLRQ